MIAAIHARKSTDQSIADYGGLLHGLVGVNGVVPPDDRVASYTRQLTRLVRAA
jgi:hypothetical protein